MPIRDPKPVVPINEDALEAADAELARGETTSLDDALEEIESEDGGTPGASGDDPEQPADEAEAEVQAVVEACPVTVATVEDTEFAQAFDTDQHIASCEKCGFCSSPRSSEQRARSELAALCAARLAQTPED